MAEDTRLAVPLNDTDGDYGGHMIFCPACRYGHLFDKRWTFNGNEERPTFRASMLIYEGGGHPRCHSFVTDGEIRFLDDCTHEMAGQTVALQPM